MKRLTQLSLRQRYNLTFFGTIALTSLLLMALLSWFTTQYLSEYTSRYWQDYAKTFANSVGFQVVLGSVPGTHAVAHNFASDKNVYKASVFSSQNELLASSGDHQGCQTNTASFTSPFFLLTDEVWCFYSPIVEADNTIGHVELVISKAELSVLMLHIWLASAVIIVIFSGVIFILVRRQSTVFTSTLDDMAVALKKTMDKSDDEHRQTFYGTSDIEIIREGFADMLTKIELNKQALEQQVEDKTNELKIALEGSQAANIYKSQLMTSITHEMKTPLHAVIGYLQTLSQETVLCDLEGVDFDLIRIFLNSTLLRANELKDNIDNILLQSRLEANKFNLSISTVAVKPLMQECAEKIKLSHNRNRNRLEILGQDISVPCDSEVLRHIVNNLLSNAYKFTQEGDIQLIWRQEHDDLIIQVSDTGCGICDENRSRIFDAFWQEDMSLSRKFGGHGLGLAIVQQFVQRLSGSITVISNAGKGTTFTVRIPVSTS